MIVLFRLLLIVLGVLNIYMYATDQWEPNRLTGIAFGLILIMMALMQ